MNFRLVSDTSTHPSKPVWKILISLMFHLQFSEQNSTSHPIGLFRTMHTYLKFHRQKNTDLNILSIYLSFNGTDMEMFSLVNVSQHWIVYLQALDKVNTDNISEKYMWKLNLSNTAHYIVKNVADNIFKIIFQIMLGKNLPFFIRSVNLFFFRKL